MDSYLEIKSAVLFRGSYVCYALEQHVALVAPMHIPQRLLAQIFVCLRAGIHFFGLLLLMQQLLLLPRLLLLLWLLQLLMLFHAKAIKRRRLGAIHARRIGICDVRRAWLANGEVIEEQQNGHRCRQEANAARRAASKGLKSHFAQGDLASRLSQLSLQSYCLALLFLCMARWFSVSICNDNNENSKDKQH